MRDRTLRYRLLLLILYLFHCRTHQRVLLGKLFLSAQKGNMPRLHQLLGETLLCDLLCIASHLFLPAPSSSAYSSAALPAYPKLPSGELKRDLFPPPFFLFCFAAVLPCGRTCPTRAGLLPKNMGGKGGAPEGIDVLALLPLQPPSQ